MRYIFLLGLYKLKQEDTKKIFNMKKGNIYWIIYTHPILNHPAKEKVRVLRQYAKRSFFVVAKTLDKGGGQQKNHNPPKKIDQPQ